MSIPTSGWPSDRSWVLGMSERLLLCAAELRVDSKEVSCEELISSDSLLTEVGAALRRHGWPKRYPQEIRQELLRLQARYEKRVVNGKFMNESARMWFSRNPHTWIDESEDEDDIFMPRGALSSKGKSDASSSRSKTASSSRSKSVASPRSKTPSSSRSKSVASSKSKTDAGGCVDGR